MARTAEDFIRNIQTQNLAPAEISSAITKLRSQGVDSPEFDSILQNIETPKAQTRQPRASIDRGIPTDTQQTTVETQDAFGDVTQIGQRKTQEGVAGVSGQLRPQQLTGAESFLVFGKDAEAQEVQSPGFLSKRNDALASDFAARGVMDASGILRELEQSPSFAGASAQDKMNTARAIADRIGAMEKEPEFDAQAAFQETVAGAPRFDAQAEVERGVQDFARQLQRGGVVGLDRPIEDMTLARDRRIQDLDRQLENVKIGISQDIEDVAREADRSIRVSEKVGALTGQVRSSGYREGISNIKEDSIRTIDRLKQARQRAIDATGEQKKRLQDDYERDVRRAKEDFQFQYRSLMDDMNINLAEITEKYGFSDDKILNEIDRITLDTIKNIQEAESNYYTNLQSANRVVQSQLDLIAREDEIFANRQDRFLDRVAQNEESLASLSFQDFDTFVQQGLMDANLAQIYKAGIKNKAFATLNAFGKPTQEDIDYLLNGLEQNLTPNQLVQSIISANPERYSQAQDVEQFTLTPGQVRFDTQGNVVAQNPKTTEETVDIRSGLAVTNTGERAGDTGVDMVVTPGEVYPTPVSGVVQFIREEPNGAKNALGQTNVQMQVKTDDGYTVTFNHLDPAMLQRLDLQGQRIEQGQMALIAGNTGKVLTLDNGQYRAPTAQELQQGRGGHFDIRIRDPEGNAIVGKAAQNFLAGGEQEPTFTLAEIARYNEPTFKPTKDLKTREGILRYNQFLEQKAAVMSDENATLEDILYYSRGGGDVLNAPAESLSKYQNVLSGLKDVQELVEDVKT